MPEFTFHGPYDGQYPGHRDLDHQPLGLVIPGDIRDTGGPLDSWWRETTDEDREALAARLAAEEAARTAGEDGDGQDPDPAGDSGDDESAGDSPPAPASPPAVPALAPPAAPAAVPPAATSAGPAGTTPQEG
jgi:hypothetical protein